MSLTTPQLPAPAQSSHSTPSRLIAPGPSLLSSTTRALTLPLGSSTPGQDSHNDSCDKHAAHHSCTSSAAPSFAN